MTSFTKTIIAWNLASPLSEIMSYLVVILFLWPKLWLFYDFTILRQKLKDQNLCDRHFRETRNSCHKKCFWKEKFWSDSQEILQISQRTVIKAYIICEKVYKNFFKIFYSMKLVFFYKKHLINRTRYKSKGWIDNSSTCEWRWNNSSQRFFRRFYNSSEWNYSSWGRFRRNFTI